MSDSTGMDNFAVVTMSSDGLGLVQRESLASVAAWFDRVEGSQSGGPAQPYRRIPPVRAAVSRKANALASMPLRISTSSDQLIESGPLYDLIERPNPRMSAKDFWRATSAWLDLTGVCHWVFLPGTMIGRRPTEIHPVGAWQMKPRVVDGELTGWLYRPAGKRWDQALQLGLDEVWSVGEDAFDPTDPFGYSSPLEAAGLAIAQLYKADLANEASLDNGVEPGGAYRHPGKPTADQIRDMREQISDRAGAKNRRRPLILYGGMEWQQIAATFDEMEFSELQRMKVVDVCVALDIDPAAIGYYQDSNYAHAEAAKTGMWLDTVLPRGQWLADEFDRGIVSRFEDRHQVGWRTAGMQLRHRRATCYRAARAKPGATGRRLFVWFDDSGVAAIRKSKLQLAAEGIKWAERGVPLNQLIEAHDLPYETQPWGDTWYKPLGLVDVQDDSLTLPGEDDPPGNESDDDDEQPSKQDDEQEKSLRQQQARADAERELTEAQLARIWQMWRESWAGLERAFRAKVTRHFTELRGEVLRSLNEAMAQGKSIERRDVVGQVLFDLVQANKRLLVKVGPLVRETYRLGGAQAMREAADASGQDKPDPFAIDAPEVTAAMRRRQIRISETNRTLRRRLAKELAEGIEQQETVSEIADRVRKEFNVAASRANTIARTEVGGALEDARQQGRAQAGTPLKSWLWSRKESGRPWHFDTETMTLRKPVPNHELFTLAQTGAQTPHPRGPGLTAEDAANCGCSTIARYPDDTVKAVLARYAARGFLTYEQLQRDGAANPETHDAT